MHEYQTETSVSTIIIDFFYATCWHAMHSYQYGGKSPPPLNSESADLVYKALENLSEFMSTPNAREKKNRQKLLRNLKVGLMVLQAQKT